MLTAQDVLKESLAYLGDPVVRAEFVEFARALATELNDVNYEQSESMELVTKHMREVLDTSDESEANKAAELAEAAAEGRELEDEDDGA